MEWIESVGVCWYLAGLLEWQEIQKPNEAGQRMTCSLPCHSIIGSAAAAASRGIIVLQSDLR